MVIGGLIGWTMGGSFGWKTQLGLFLIPTLVYGIMFLGQKCPSLKLRKRSQFWRNV